VHVVEERVHSTQYAVDLFGFLSPNSSMKPIHIFAVLFLGAFASSGKSKEDKAKYKFECEIVCQSRKSTSTQCIFLFSPVSLNSRNIERRRVDSIVMIKSQLGDPYLNCIEHASPSVS